MNWKNVLFFLIIILLICFLILIFTIGKYVKLTRKSENKIITDNIVNEENITEDEINGINEVNEVNEIVHQTENEENNNKIIDNSIDYDNTDYIFYNEDETGDEEYKREQLNGFNFKITNLPDNVEKYIKDRNEFNIKIKEYVYLHGLIQASTAKYEKHEFENGKMLVIFSINDNKNTNLYVTVNLKDNSIQIYDE